jgi:hypothetical protein
MSPTRKETMDVQINPFKTDIPNTTTLVISSVKVLESQVKEFR